MGQCPGYPLCLKALTQRNREVRKGTEKAKIGFARGATQSRARSREPVLSCAGLSRLPRCPCAPPCSSVSKTLCHPPHRIARLMAPYPQPSSGQEKRAGSRALADTSGRPGRHCRPGSAQNSHAAVPNGIILPGGKFCRAEKGQRNEGVLSPERCSSSRKHSLFNPPDTTWSLVPCSLRPWRQNG